MIRFSSSFRLSMPSAGGAWKHPASSRGQGVNRGTDGGEHLRESIG